MKGARTGLLVIDLTSGQITDWVRIEGVMDELAGEDPLGFRLRHLDDPPARAVLERAAPMGGFARRPALPAGAGPGRAHARPPKRALIHH